MQNKYEPMYKIVISNQTGSVVYQTNTVEVTGCKTLEINETAG